MKTHLTVAVALVVATSPLVAQPESGDDAHWLQECREHNWNDHARYCEIRVDHVANASGPIDVDARENGGVELIGRSANDIVVHELIQAEGSSDADAKDLASQVHVVINGGRIRADGPPEQHRHHSWTVSYRVEVPHQIDATAESINGPLEASDVTGRLELRTENGPIELSAVGGTVRARTENGPLEVTLTGSRWSGQGLDAETENGPVELSLPKGYAAHLETGTVNGPISIDFPITVEGRINVKQLSMDIGGGGPTVRVVTTNGPVTVGH